MGIEENKKNKLEWSEDFSVGDQTIDFQHKKILEYIRLLPNYPYNSVKNDEFHELLAEIADYALFHLDYEEKLLKRLNYPGYEEHKAHHEKLVTETALFSFNASSNDENTPENLEKFLLSWWYDHILVEDMKFKSFFLSRKGYSRQVN